MKRTNAVVIVALPLLFCTATARAQSDSTGDVTRWLQAHCAAVSDNNLAAFKPIIRNARVIGFAEAAHGIQEFLSFRNRLVEYLIQNDGVTAIAAETGYSESVDVDNYVQGRGELTPALVGSVFAWSAGTPYAENRRLLEWLRAYNARSSTTRKVHFYGIDLTGGRAGRFVQARRAIDDAFAYALQVDSVQTRALQQRLTPFLTHFSSALYDSLSSNDQNALTAALHDLLGVFDRRAVVWQARSSEAAYQQARQQVVVALQLDENFRAAAAESNPQAQREPAMAHNLAWVREREGLAGRVFLYEANWHISRGPMSTDGCCTALGEYLGTGLGRDYVAIGSAFSEAAGGDGAEPGSLAQLLAQLPAAQCLLDLLALPVSGPVAQWFSAMRTLRAGRPDRMQLSHAFDAVLFTHTVHDATPMN